MMKHQGKFVRNLVAWELLRTEELESAIVDELTGKARALYFDRELFAEEFYVVFLDRLRELAAAAVNETIEYWAKGLADGNDGKYPELCVELPYLERAEAVNPLTMAYCVDNEDGTRTELLRVTLGSVVNHLLEGEGPWKSRKHGLQLVAAELKAPAQELESRQ